jgi:hypothetical protein
MQLAGAKNDGVQHHRSRVVRERDLAPVGLLKTPLRKQRAMEIIISGQKRLSRTACGKPSVTLPMPIADSDLIRRVEVNLRAAAAIVIERYRTLPVNLETCFLLHSVLMRGIEEGEARYDHVAPSLGVVFAWLESDEALEIGRRDPFVLADRLHRQIIGYDCLPGGNGRTARLLVDLLLLRNGWAPALYGSRKEYYASTSGGGPLGPGPTEQERAAYFRRLADRGVRFLETGKTDC